ncbi:hypothetical protein pb186bvf_003457 [Paramecium bursaria]
MRYLVLTVLILSVLSLRVQRQSPQKLQAELAKSNYGRALLHLVELHSLAQGPVQELIEGIEELVNDLQTGLEDLDYGFARRTNEHNSLVVQLNQAIQDAQIDVSRSEDVIDNLLIPRRDQLIARIDNLVENQDLNRKSLGEAEVQRETEIEAYNLQVEELNGATAAVDEALQLLATLTNPSLLQVKKFQNSLKKIESKIKSRSKMAPFLKALISLASNQNFSDQSVIGSIVNALNEFRNAVVDSLNDLTAQEAQNQEDFEERVDQLNAEHAEFQRQINAVNIDLTATNEKLESVQQFRDQRELDRVSYQTQLDLENEQFAEETQIYQDTKVEYQRELGISEQALALVQSVDFSSIKV